jgi:hypothetical protein
MTLTMTFLAIAAVFLVGVVVVHSYHTPVRTGSAPRGRFPRSRFQFRAKTFIVHDGPVFLDSQASVSPLNKTERDMFLDEDPSGRASISSDGDINVVY